MKRNVDKSTVVNKGVWFKNKTYKGSNFIFPTSSDLDNVLQNNFDAFEENVQSPFSSNYIDRSKRSPSYKSKSSKSRDECKDKSKCQKQNSSSQIHSKFISTLKPASVFNDYPFEVAVLLSNNNDESLNLERNSINIPEKDVNRVKLVEQKSDEASANIKDIRKDLRMNSGLEKELKPESIHLPLNVPTKDDVTNVNKTLIVPKRSMNQQNFENELIKKIEEFNNTDSYKLKNDRNIFEKEPVAWHKPLPPSKVNIYKVVPKPTEDVKKRINERGLIKVLSMLTKTFKKIMKQHSDIKQIHNKLYNLNDDFIKNIDLLTKKFEDFNVRYSEIMKVSQNLQRMEVKIRDKELNYNKKEKEFSKELTKFENQQKKFLAQQRQFYNVQKVLLQQNEQINIKQNLITKIQSEISHRQNNLAKVLKKGKQFHIDYKHSGTSISKPIQPVLNTKVVPTPFTTESVKINLFSVPTVSQLKDQDQLIMGEKDSQPVDDLIYKYYFNNTFIDDIMKNKILASFIASESTFNNKTKNKRNEVNLNTTILLPINKTKSKIRNRRWIKNLKKYHLKETRRNETKTPTLSSKVKDNLANNNSKDPFQNMALNFCREIGQNVNTQILNWCIEKILRRLKVIDLKRPSSIQINEVKKKQGLGKSTLPKQPFVSTTANTLNKKVDTATSSAVTKQTTFNVFFPDNDDLENKLKEYGKSDVIFIILKVRDPEFEPTSLGFPSEHATTELTPDPEGTVYYDGSLHSSDLGHKFNVDSEGFSDIMPGLDSDSRIQVDPFAIDLQEQRRAEVRKINARIMKMKMG
ncbi:unnamed protein product, partial [Brenthis ino]